MKLSRSFLTLSDICSSCSKPLGLINGKNTCPCCLKNYCDLHCLCDARITANGQLDPSGSWTRVCYSCFSTKPGFLDLGFSRSWWDHFQRLRQKHLERVLLEYNLLFKRALKLSIAYQQESDSLLFKASKRLQLEKSLVPWQPDHTIHQCPLDSTLFSFIQRKHHCRLCGRIICGNPSCLCFLPFQNYTIKSCTTCYNIISLRQSKTVESVQVTLTKLYNAMMDLKAVIIEALPTFNELIMTLSAQKIKSAQHPQYQTAIDYRKTLLDYFGKMDSLGKQIRGLPAAPGSHAQRLQDNIYFSIIQFLQNHMFTLQLLPNLEPPSPLGKQNFTASEKEIMKALEEEIVVLQDQSKQVEAYLVDATSRRRFEDAQMLKESLDELTLELSRKRDEWSRLTGQPLTTLS